MIKFEGFEIVNVRITSQPRHKTIGDFINPNGLPIEYTYLIVHYQTVVLVLELMTSRTSLRAAYPRAAVTLNKFTPRFSLQREPSY
jgi:hypothetical protein